MSLRSFGSAKLKALFKDTCTCSNCLSMRTLYQQIGDKFLVELQNSTDVGPRMLEALKPLFAEGKKLKSDDLVKIFTSAGEDEVK